LNLQCITTSINLLSKKQCFAKRASKIYAEFSKICQDYGIKFIGPSPEMIGAMGDKATAKSWMKKAGVPTVPGSDGLLKSIH
jgi:biotin carboxylase